MYYPEEIIAAVFALGLGIALLARPTTVYRLQFFVYGADTGRGGRYGEAPSPSARGRRIIRIVGVGLLGVAVALLLSPWWR